MHVHSVSAAPDSRPRAPATSADVSWHFPLFLAHGITGIRNMNDGTGDPTLTLMNSVKSRLASGDLEGPRLIANGPTVDGDPPGNSNNPVMVRDAAEARVVVNSLVDAGADFIKVYDTLSRDAYFALMDQAAQRGIAVDGHLPFRVRPEEAADAGQRTIEHVLAMAAGCATGAEAEREAFAATLASPLDPVQRAMLFFRHERALYDTRDPASCAATIEAYRRSGMAAAPSLVGYHHLLDGDDYPETQLVPDAVREDWDSFRGPMQMMRSILEPVVPLQAANVRMLNEAGVLLLAATDVGVPMLVPGFSLHEELVLLVGAGLTPLEALRTATLNPARVLGLADSLGTVEAGKLADLVLLEGNPLADIANTQRIRAVVGNGRLYRRSDLNRLLDEARSAQSVR
jgi:imidazolonepropionase-like amidohydrolase